MSNTAKFPNFELLKEVAEVFSKEQFNELLKNAGFKRIKPNHRRTEREMALIWSKLHSIDITQYTADQLLEYLDYKVNKSVMIKHLVARRMKYKNAPRHAR